VFTRLFKTSTSLFRFNPKSLWLFALLVGRRSYCMAGNVLILLLVLIIADDVF
jgi:hypothetical protein